MDDHSDKNTIDDTMHKINTKHNTKPNNVCSDLKNTWETRELVLCCYSLRSQSLFLLLLHSSLAHRTLAQDVCFCVSFHPMVITMSHA